MQSNPGFLLVILLARVITMLGTLEHINPITIEGLYAADLAFLLRPVKVIRHVRYLLAEPL